MAKATKKSATKVEVKKSPGRPPVYDAATVVKHLKKFEGQPGGLKNAHKALQGLKAFAKISYATLCNIAAKNEIRFGLGKPKEKPVKKPVKAKASKKKTAETVTEPLADAA